MSHCLLHHSVGARTRSVTITTDMVEGGHALELIYISAIRMVVFGMFSSTKATEVLSMSPTWTGLFYMKGARLNDANVRSVGKVSIGLEADVRA